MEMLPKELQYAETHEWVREEEDGTMAVGITEHAQSLLGELVFVQLPEIGVAVHAGDEVCVVESVKAASDVYSPISGKIVAINEALEESPSLINQDPYGDGWLFTIAPKDKSEMEHLLDHKAYQEHIQEKEAEEDE